ncbi:hypothetical protein MUP01_12110 [Candidatus Bathyarchaeota archaeon]|nr:hypothetical protein [Candidatus Bathyarchaeota archaeon]
MVDERARAERVLVGQIASSWISCSAHIKCCIRHPKGMRYVGATKCLGCDAARYRIPDLTGFMWRNYRTPEDHQAVLEAARKHLAEWKKKQTTVERVGHGL